MKTPPRILFWLLLAATAAVDAVAIMWMMEGGTESQAAFLYDALVTAQLSVVTMWGVFGARNASTALVAAVLAVGVVSLLEPRFAELSLAEAGGIYGSFVSLLALVLWLLKQTSFWRQLVGSDESNQWQYSMSHMLAAMTVVALVIVALRGSELLLESEDLWKSLVMLTIGDVALATSVLIVWLWTSWQPYWWPRLAAAFLPALAIGALETSLALVGVLGDEYTAIQAYSPFGMVANTLIASLVIFAYLELAPIVRRGSRTVSMPSESTKQ